MESGGGDGNIKGRQREKWVSALREGHWEGFNYVLPPQPFAGLQLSCGLQFL